MLGLVGIDGGGGGGGLEYWWPMQIWFTSNYGYERAPCYYHCSSHPCKWSLFFFFFFFFYVVSGGARLVDVLAKSWWMLQLCWRKEIRGENSVAATPVTRWALPLPSSPTVAAPILPQFYCSTTVFARFIGVGGELLLLLFFCFCLILCCLCYFVLLCITRYFDFFSRLIRDFTYSCWG